MIPNKWKLLKNIGECKVFPLNFAVLQALGLCHVWISQRRLVDPPHFHIDNSTQMFLSDGPVEKLHNIFFRATGQRYSFTNILKYDKSLSDTVLTVLQIIWHKITVFVLDFYYLTCYTGNWVVFLFYYKIHCVQIGGVRVSETQSFIWDYSNNVTGTSWALGWERTAV